MEKNRRDNYQIGLPTCGRNFSKPCMSELLYKSKFKDPSLFLWFCGQPLVSVNY